VTDLFDADPRAHLGVGWAFPVQLVDGRLGWARYEDDIDQAVEIVLRTVPGERAMLPAFGADLRRQVFEPNTAPTHRALEDTVRQALLDWEPRIKVEAVSAVPDGDVESLVLVHVDYLVRATNTYYNRVFPFYLTEAGA
jgi:phage baseplate assembly protein W